MLMLTASGDIDRTPDGKAAAMGLLGGRRISGRQWLTLAAALLGWMFDGFEQSVVPVVGRPALIDMLGLKANVPSGAGEVSPEAKATVEKVVGFWMSWFNAAYLLGAALGGWSFGWLGDRFGRVRAMAVSVLTYSLFTGLCGLAQAPWQMAALRFVAAVGMGGEWALGVALVMETWEPEARPLLAGLIGAAANVGFMLSAAMVALLPTLHFDVGAGGWRWVFGACALPALLTFFLRIFVPESEKWQHAVASGPPGRLTDIFTPQLRRYSIIGAVLGAVALVATWGPVQMVVPWVQKVTGGDQRWAGAVQLWAGFGAVVGTILAAVSGRWIDRRKTYFFLCLGSLLVSAYLFRGLANTGPEPGVPRLDGWFLFVVFLTGGLTASFYGWFPLYLPELFPTRIRATGQGFCYNAGRILAVPGVLGMGFLVGAFDGSYPRAGATITLIYLVGMVVVWLAPETRGRPLPE
jgi:MFS family permease